MTPSKDQDEQTEKIVEYYKNVADEYDRNYDAPYWRDFYDKITWAFAEPYLPQKGEVLDAGGGTGKWSIPMAARGLHVTLVDISKEMLAVANAKIEWEGLQKLVTVKQGDIRNLDFPSNNFDFVLAAGDAVSYCGDGEKAISELTRVVKPSRHIVVSVDSVYPLMRRRLLEDLDFDAAIRFLTERKFEVRGAGFESRAFTPEELRELLEKRGLEVLKIIGKPVSLGISNENVNRVLSDPEAAKKLLRLQMMLCEVPSVSGFGGHLQAVARKRRLSPRLR
ncbi:MAG: class I SAM-dependent methyltransferase [Nitrososphaeria archaeon]